MRTSSPDKGAADGSACSPCLLPVPISAYRRHVENVVPRAKPADHHLVRVGVDADVVRVALADHQIAARPRAGVHETMADLPACGEADIVAGAHVVSIA